MSRQLTYRRVSQLLEATDFAAIRIRRWNRLITGQWIAAPVVREFDEDGNLLRTVYPDGNPDISDEVNPKWMTGPIDE
jgi:hypothetical protein